MPLLDSDRNDIMQLAGHYAQAIDAATSPATLDDTARSLIEEWADCFTADGAYESELQGRFSGRSALVRFAEVSRTLTHTQGTRYRHWTSHWVVDGDGDDATATSYVMLMEAKSGTIVALGVYHDRLKRTPAGWKFAERVVSLDSDLDPQFAETLRAEFARASAAQSQ